MEKKVSIIVPLYNASAFLSDTINSIVSQSYKNWELILVDDGSDDNPASIINQYLPHDKIQFVTQENQGVSAARNAGFELSTGEYVAFLDADDLWLPQNLEKKARYLEANPEVGLVHSNMETINEKGEKTGEIKSGKEGFILRDLLLWNGCCIPAPSSILVRSEIVRETKGFDSQFSTAADQDFFFRVTANYPVGKISTVLGQYRIHGSNMHQNIAVMEKDHIAVYRKAGKNKLFKSVLFRQKCFSNLYLILAGSWWVNGNNKWRGVRFVLLSIINNPLNSYKLLKKMFK